MSESYGRTPYVDQLEGSGGLDEVRVAALTQALDDAERALSDGGGNATAAEQLTDLATALEGRVETATGRDRVRMESLVRVLAGLADRLG